MCDGIGCDGFVWKYLKEDLADDYRLIRWHYRGHGRSPKPRDPSRITTVDFADDLATVLDETNTDTAVLMGHSMGVQVSLECYRRHRDRADALVLVCGAPGHLLKTFRGTTGRLEPLLPSVQKAIAKLPWLFNGISRFLVPTKFAWNVATLLEIDPELVNPVDFMPYLRGLSQVEPAYFVKVLEAATEHSAEDVLPDIAVPTLVIAGEKDGFTPPDLSHRMAEEIPGAELLSIERGSHTAPLERPGMVAGAILRFLDSHLNAPHRGSHNA